MLRTNTELTTIDKSPNQLDLKDFKLFLFESGAKSFSTACSTWRHCMVLERFDGDRLFFLFRKRGLDIKYFAEDEDGVNLMAGDIISFSGGETYRYSYKTSIDNIHAKFFYIAKSFLSGSYVKSKLSSSDG